MALTRVTYHDDVEAERPSILSKAFDLLRAFNPRERVMTLSELSRASGLPKSTVHRLLARLIDLGAVEHHRYGYKIGLGLLQLGASTPAGYMRDLAMPYLTNLHRWSRQRVNLGVLRKHDVVFLEELTVGDSPSSLSGVGARLPANCIAAGKALLAYENLNDLGNSLPSPMPMMTPKSITDVGTLVQQLREVRATGVARETEEAQLGLECIGVPITMNGFAVGAVSVSFSADTPAVSNLVGAVQTTVAQIVKELDAGLAQEREHWFPREI